MDPLPPRPIPGHAALLLPPVGALPAEIAVADLHVGLGVSGRTGLGLAERTARAMAEELLAVAHQEGARGIVTVGDAKHPIVGSQAHVGRLLFDLFATLLSDGLAVRLVRGNHDVGIDRHLPREVEILPASGWRRGEVGLFHGHRWPTERVLAAPRLVVGHLHPGFRFAPGPGPSAAGKFRCWVRTDLRAYRPPPRARRHVLRAREVIVLPAFNPIAGIESLNLRAPARNRSFLLHRFLAKGPSRAYLLDGTDLGPIEFPEPAPRPKREGAATVRRKRRGRRRSRTRAPSGP
jgi:metallophosphoesterase superfamily enzyme